MTSTVELAIQGFTPPLRWADFRIAAFDMDSTLINIECIDEIAAVAGKKAEVAAITEAAMRGEIPDFRASLMRRLAILEGLDEAALQTVLDTRLQLNPGAEKLLATLHAKGIKTLLVSGGFTFFARVVQAKLGITVLTNAQPRGLAEAIALAYGELALGDAADGALTADWLTVMQGRMRGLYQPLGQHAGQPPAAAPAPPQPLARYAGDYTNA